MVRERGEARKKKKNTQSSRRLKYRVPKLLRGGLEKKIKQRGPKNWRALGSVDHSRGKNRDQGRARHDQARPEGFLQRKNLIKTLVAVGGGKGKVIDERTALSLPR